jgi:hypothetical protein
MAKAQLKTPEPHVHGPDCGHNQGGEPQEPFRHADPKQGRNDPCSCGSGMKYKKCHGANG